MRVGSLVALAALLLGAGCAELGTDDTATDVADGSQSSSSSPAGENGAAEPAKAVAFAHQDRLYVRTRHGLVVFASGDRYFGPVDSPNRQRVAFQGLATGIHVYDLSSGELSHLGAGTAPAWAPDSQRLAFERTEDDGQELTASTIWVWRRGGVAQQVFAHEGVIARRPLWSADGSSLAFDDDQGEVYTLAQEAWQ